MSYPTVALALVTIFTTISVTSGFAQTATPPSAPPPDEPKSIVDRLKEPDQAGGLHFTEHWAVAFGGIKQGSGAGAGPAWSTKFADGGFVQLKAVISIRNFRLLQARYDTRRFWNERAIVVSRLRWHDAPAVKLYRLGPDSPDRHVDYAERRTEASSQLVFTVRPSLRAAGGFGVERFRTRADHLSELFDPEELALQAPPPGLGAHPVFAHAFARLGYDTRLSPDYTRDGRFVEGEIHVYRDVHGVEDAFGRFEGTVAQHVPTHGGRGVIGVSARTWLSLAEGQRSVPFYLTPTLGGGDLLRAYPTYRFRDRHAILYLAQYRWAVHKFVDLAATYEAGKVAPEISGLSFDNIAQSIAFGVRLHTKKVGLVRSDVAYGREGVIFHIGFTAGG